MKKTRFFLLIALLLIASFIAGISFCHWQHQHRTRKDMKEFREAEKGLDKLFQLPDTLKPKPKPEPNSREP